MKTFKLFPFTASVENSVHFLEMFSVFSTERNYLHNVQLHLTSWKCRTMNVKTSEKVLHSSQRRNLVKQDAVRLQITPLVVHNAVARVQKLCFLLHVSQTVKICYFNAAIRSRTEKYKLGLNFPVMNSLAGVIVMQGISLRCLNEV